MSILHTLEIDGGLYAQEKRTAPADALSRNFDVNLRCSRRGCWLEGCQDVERLPSSESKFGPGGYRRAVTVTMRPCGASTGGGWGGDKKTDMYYLEELYDT